MSKSAFLIVEQFIWTKAKAESNPDKTHSIIDSAWKYRDSFAKKSILRWYTTVERSARGVMIFTGTLNELQDFFKNDPFTVTEMVKRDVTPLRETVFVDGAPEIKNMSPESLQKEALSLKEQAAKGDFDLFVVNPELTNVLMDTTNNGY